MTPDETKKIFTTDLAPHEEVLLTSSEPTLEKAEIQVVGGSRNRLATGSTVSDRFEVLSLVGEGGMGTVYKARHKKIGRMVALKVLHSASVADELSLKRFEQEAKAAAALSHPNLATVHDYGETEDGSPYLVMDFLDGTGLDNLLQHGAIGWQRAVPIFLQICQGLKHAHGKNIIHRDIKPSNVVLSLEDGTETAKIVDFGIAKAVGFAADEAGALTKTGEIFGSPFYMSPEQCTGAEIDARSDIYSLGCLMYEVLCGVRPVEAPNAIQTVLKHLNETPLKFAQQVPGIEIPAEIERIVFRALEKNKEARYQSVQELEQDLLSFQQGVSSSVPVKGSSLSSSKPPIGYKPPSASGSGGSKDNGTLKLVALSLIAVVVFAVAAIFLAKLLQEQRVHKEQQAELMERYTSSNNTNVRYVDSHTGQPKTKVIWVHQAFDQGRSMDDDYNHIGHITVNVSKSNKDLVLVLGSYAPIEWRVDVPAGATIKAVILSGIYESSVSGLSPATKIFRTSDYDRNGQERKDPLFKAFNLNILNGENLEGNSYFNDMGKVIEKLTGRKISDFEFREIGRDFAV